MTADAAPRVHILLSTFNGAAFLAEQLASITAQSFPAWVLHWRDDGSRDGTAAIMRAFAAGPGAGRCFEHRDGCGNLGVLRSYMALLRAADAAMLPDDALAFADQDDVWLPDKLARGVAALAGRADAGAALYCTRLRLVDAALRPLGLSAPWRRPGGFPAALTQNIATGCTMMLNRAAVGLAARAAPPPASLHDWWCYLVVAAAGGALLRDERPSVLYRQHGANAVGVAPSLPRRALAALRRGPGDFMDLFHAHVAALLARPDDLTDRSRRDLGVLDRALRDGVVRRAGALRLRGLRRQTRLEQATFALWFLIG